MDHDLDLDQLQVDIPKADTQFDRERDPRDPREEAPAQKENTYSTFSIEQISELGNKSVKQQNLRDIQKILRTVYRPEHSFQQDTYAENADKFVADFNDQFSLAKSHLYLSFGPEARKNVQESNKELC